MLITIKQFAEKHYLTKAAIYQRARTTGFSLKAVKVDGSPLYKEEDLLNLVPPLWKRKPRKKNTEMKSENREVRSENREVRSENREVQDEEVQDEEVRIEKTEIKSENKEAVIERL